MRRMTVPLLLSLALVSAGCATGYSRGAAAYRQGDYVEAATRFEDVLARNPTSIDALIGLGLSRYRLGDHEAAVTALERAAAQAPDHPIARLYLGLAYLADGQDGRAEEHLQRFIALAPPRTAAQVERALRLLRGALPPSDDVRTFVAASLEAETAWAQDLRLAQQRVRELERQRLYDYPRAYYVRCR